MRQNKLECLSLESLIKCMFTWKVGSYKLITLTTVVNVVVRCSKLECLALASLFNLV